MVERSETPGHVYVSWCREALVADEAEVRYDTGLRTGRNATGKVHLRCVREAVRGLPTEHI